MTVTAAHYRKAVEEGRTCLNCGWIISKCNWKKGYKLCAGCYDALRGVRVKWGYGRYLDEPRDRTGES